MDKVLIVAVIAIGVGAVRDQEAYRIQMLIGRVPVT